MAPETAYAQMGDLHVAYQVMGVGPVDIVYVPGWVSHLELEMENPLSRSFYERLASIGRLIRFDKRGTGMSDRDFDATALEHRVGDITGVMDAVGSEQAVLFGFSEGGTLAATFAALHPERVTRMVLFASHAGRVRGAPDFPCGYEADEAIAWMRSVVQGRWGEGATLEHLAPTMWGVDGAREWMARYERTAATPGAALAHFDVNMDNDARGLLPSVRAPTLVLQRRGDRFVPPCNGRFLLEQIPDARLVELDGDDHLPYVGDVDRVVDEVARFVTGRVDGPWASIAPGVWPASLTGLTPAQRRVAELVAEGLSNPQIAERLHVSRHTVESHVKAIFSTLGLRSRVELTRLVLGSG